MSESMMGSGIYSIDVDVEIVCKEHCYECEDAKQACDAIFKVLMMTDDWGNVDEDVTCGKCNHKFNYRTRS